MYSFKLKRVAIFINNNVKSFQIDESVFNGINADHIWCSISFGAEFILCGCIVVVHRPPYLCVQSTISKYYLPLQQYLNLNMMVFSFVAILIILLYLGRMKVRLSSTLQLVVILTVNYTVMLSAP